MASRERAMTSVAAEDVWWHRRIVLVSEDSTWISSMLDSLPARTGVAEGVTCTEATRLTGPIGAMICHIDRPRSLAESVLRAYEHWSTLAWQPCTLTWLAPRPGAARIRATLGRLGFPTICTPEFSISRDDKAHAWDIVATRLDTAPWVVSHFAQRLGWTDPHLIEILSVPVLRPDVSTVREWGRSVRLSYGELADVCREHGCGRPKRLLELIRLGAELARVSASGRRVTRDLMAKRLGYSSGDYLGRRVKLLSECTLGDLMTMPLMDALEILPGLATRAPKTIDPSARIFARTIRRTGGRD